MRRTYKNTYRKHKRNLKATTIQELERLSKIYNSSEFPSYICNTKFEIPFGRLSELYQDNSKIGLAHLCEHLFGEVLFNKTGIVTKENFINDNYVTFQVNFNNKKEIKEIIRKIKKVIKNFDISEEDVEKEKRILIDEMRTLSCYELGDTIKYLFEYNKLMTLVGLECDIRKITKYDVINYIKKYYKYIHVRELFTPINKTYQKTLTRMTDIEHVCNKMFITGYTYKLWVFNVSKYMNSDIKEYLTHILLSTRNKYFCNITDKGVYINKEYLNVCYVVSDLNFNVEKFKENVMTSITKIKSKKLKRKIENIFNFHCVIYV